MAIRKLIGTLKFMWYREEFRLVSNSLSQQAQECILEALKASPLFPMHLREQCKVFVRVTPGVAVIEVHRPDGRIRTVNLGACLEFTDTEYGRIAQKHVQRWGKTSDLLIEQSMTDHVTKATHGHHLVAGLQTGLRLASERLLAEAA